MVRGAVELFARPVVRAAVPGLLAEFAADPDLHAQLLERFSDQVWGAMRDRVAAATDRGELRPGIDPSVVLELVGGAALLALADPGPRRPRRALGPVDRVGPDGRNRTMTAPERDVTTAWHELLDGLRTIDAGFLDGPRAVGGPRAPRTGIAWR